MSPTPSVREAASLRGRVLRSLLDQGFEITDGKIDQGTVRSKADLRALQYSAVAHRRETAKAKLAARELELIGSIANGKDVDPRRVRPTLVEVKRRSRDELLFRYAALHWSVPVSSGYGRRLRFLVVDSNNDKLMGLIGLGDPVFRLGARDEWVGWGDESRKQRLRHVIDAFVLGAVPPYNRLLCGKLVALLATSVEVRDAFRKKYKSSQARISHRDTDSRPALVTTASALGRSSIYNRLRMRDRLVFERVGATRGTGDFHFSNGVYSDLRAFAEKYCNPTAKVNAWGVGFRNRREVIKKALPLLGLSHDLVSHGVERELYVAPLARNTKEFLQGTQSRLRWHGDSVSSLFDFFSDRWLLPRSRRDTEYRLFDKDSWLLWH